MNFTKLARAAGAEMLIVTTMPPVPWDDADPAKWLGDRYKEQVAKMLEAAKEDNAALVDLHADFLNLDRRGIPWFSQLHNWANHPGAFGHGVFAESILRAFE